MELTLINFGGYAEYSTKLETLTAPNGAGKTTLLNAYVFALTGRTSTGFEARRAQALPDEPTSVTLHGFAGLPDIRRVLSSKGGATLYVGADVCTQTDFITVCASTGVDINFAALCADANVLTDPALTSEDLRTLLTRTEVMDNDEATALRKEATDVRKRRKTAEQFALSNVVTPLRTTPPLSVSEDTYLREFLTAASHATRVITCTCADCGRELPADIIAERRDKLAEAIRIRDERSEEAERLQAQDACYASETQAIEDAQRLIATATQARADVRVYDDRLKAIEDELRELDANAVRAELPDRVELVTEQTSKTGTTKSVCQLTYNGIPLKSVNRARRIEICVDLLASTRLKKGMQDTVPIIVDNAEALDVDSAVHGYENVIMLYVGKNTN